MSSRIFKAGKQVLATPVQLKARELNWVSYRLKGITGSINALIFSLKHEDLYTPSLVLDSETDYLTARLVKDLARLKHLHRVRTEVTLTKLRKEKGA